MKKEQKYWYLTEIEYCVICGSQTKYKHRVKVKPPESQIWRNYACPEHFL